MRTRIAVFVVVVQSILILVHLALYGTWTYFWEPSNVSHAPGFQIIFASLSVSFVAATLLAHQRFNSFVRVFYTLAAIWLGLVSFLLLAACACWIVYGVPRVIGVRLDRRPVVVVFFSLGILLGAYSVVNAARTRVKKITVKLPNLPAAWRGRTAALVSDLHLGHVRNRAFLRHIVGMLVRLQPDVLFIPGDLFDGTVVDFALLAEPWAKMSLPLGAYFVTGNHEEFSSPAKYLDAVKRSGIRVLMNEKIILDGLQIVGIDYRDSTSVDRFRSVLQSVSVDRNVASILLVHTPDRLPIAAEEGISLQLSGHTHRGQYFPFTLVVARIYGQFAYGLNRYGNLSVYTSSGAGTWGPPMRLGSNPEIVLIQFE